MKKEIIYVGDPMCSWCWGFSPVLKQIRARFAEDFQFSLIVGGLRPGTSGPMNQEMSHYIKHHWQEVNKKTGQPFSCELIEQSDFVYDTEPPARAAIIVRNLKPESVFDYFEALHEAFYAKGLDITQMLTLEDLTHKFDIAGSDFREHFESDQMKKETQSDFIQASKLGISGFPSLLLKDVSQTYILARGYENFEKLEPLLKRIASS